MSERLTMRNFKVFYSKCPTSAENTSSSAMAERPHKLVDSKGMGHLKT